MKPPQLLILADDLTGAADAAGSFARSGFRTLVRLAPGSSLSADVLALSTHSRHLPGSEAAARTRDSIAPVLESSRPPWVYKKIDSTLRGNPGAELRAVMEVLGSDRALVAPAFPEQGRTTVDGRQLVDGVPLEQTSFGGNSDLRQVFARPGTTVRHLDLDTVRQGQGLGAVLSGEGLYLADAEQEEDLRGLVCGAAEAGIRLLCGSAGLARALREILPRPAAATRGCPARPAGPVLVVAGSRNPVAVQQVERSRRAGALVLGSAAEAQAMRALAAGRDVVLTTVGLVQGDAQEVAARLGRAARAVVEQGSVGALVLTGGDTALAVCAALESTGIWLQGEVEVGIPWGVLADGPWAGLRLVTKAGGFGSGEALVTASRFLKEQSPS